jgi:hypothetical protein
VSSLAQIIKVILPHFDNYPLIYQKQGDYLLFRRIIEMMKDKLHLTIRPSRGVLRVLRVLRGVIDVVSIKASLNKGLSPKL